MKFPFFYFILINVDLFYFIYNVKKGIVVYSIFLNKRKDINDTTFYR